MGSLEEWRKGLKRHMHEESRDLDKELAKWQQMTVCGPLSLMEYFRRHRARKRGGLRPGKSGNIDRERVDGHNRIYRDYFRDNATYTDAIFRRRYRMRKPLFWKIHNSFCDGDEYFVQKRDAAGVLGLSSIQKITAALRMLALGVSADAVDEYCRIGESTTMKSLMRFTRAISVVFQAQYLRQPTKEDMEEQLKINENRGFPGMFASLDCMHYAWKNCPVAWQGLFTNKDGEKSIVLEAIADQSL
ncbi:unnamed protein product [Calypogeia fissa]